MGTPKNITEASAEVLKELPRSVTLSDGTIVQVHRMNFIQFNEVYNTLAGALAGMIAADAQASQMAPMAAMASAGTLTGAITTLVKCSPETILKLAENSARVEPGYFNERDFDDVFAVAEVALDIMAGQGHLVSFFVSIVNVFSRLSPGTAPSESPSPATKSVTPKPSTKS